MNQKKMQSFREILVEERNRIIEDLISDNEEFNSLDQTESGDLVDQAYKYHEKEFLINLSSNEQKKLKSIEEALLKIDAGTYGKCVDCGGEIDENRLEALPYADTCVSCKNKQKKILKSE